VRTEDLALEKEINEEIAERNLVVDDTEITSQGS